MSNETNHKNDMFLQKNGRKASFTNVTMVTKMLHGYMSATVPDRPMVTIIGYNNGFTYYRCVCVCVCVCVCACMRACVCEFCEKSIFSVSFRARILTFHILAMTNRKMTFIQRLLASMS